MALHFTLQHLDSTASYARILFVDFSSAFNTIIPSLLQDKLSLLNAAAVLQGTSVISPGFHIGSVMALAGMIAKKSAVGLLQAHPCAYALTFGLVATKITCKLVVAHMTRTEMFLLDSAFMGPGLLFLDQYFNSVLCELLVLCLALVLSCYDLARYCVGAWLQVAAHLHGSVMVVAPPKPASRHRDTARQQQQQPPLYKQQPQQSPPPPYKHSSQQ
ncbi:choline/ethanolaminephosphotransferase 1-like [Lethenteron reissneri]|uniref:choline/ethanolaminephosphotransferase 1-like n=1 Tax=Lethenteron reissneri TaxID=7753 RepID=UPI002AB6D1F3|nr:choline/ethanolaminephosphotransferase 1-like [Lethenteron reissneri]